MPTSKTDSIREPRKSIVKDIAPTWFTACFKGRRKFGLDMKLVPLKVPVKARHTKKLSVDGLWHFAKINQVINEITPNLEAVA